MPNIYNIIKKTFKTAVMQPGSTIKPFTILLIIKGNDRNNISLYYEGLNSQKLKLAKETVNCVSM